MQNRSGKTVKQSQHPLMTALKDTPDTAGGMMDTGGGAGGMTVKPSKGGAPKGMMVDGPYGGKVKA